MTRIDAIVTRTVAQLDELLDVARLEANQSLQLNLQRTDLVALANRVVGEYQQTTTMHRLRVESEVPRLEGLWDAPRLDRILANLISNAIKYSPNGGEIVVHVRRGPEVVPHAHLIIQDPGIGIPETDLPQLFAPFYRGSNAEGRLPGTGLGLSGVRQIVEQHGGTIGVSSKEGIGSTFTVRLPIQCES
jgi:signal transduction histidine kinase